MRFDRQVRINGEERTARIIVGRVTWKEKVEQREINGEMLDSIRYGVAVQVNDEKDYKNIKGAQIDEKGRATIFYSVSALGKNAVNFEKFSGVGKLIAVKGYETVTEKDGKVYYNLNVSRMEFLEFASSNNSNNNNNTPNNNNDDEGGFHPIEDDDIPF